MECQGLQDMGISELNEMQTEVLRVYSNAKNLVLLSPTGTGKTIAFLLPLLASIDKKHRVLQAMIIVPSRELAIQIHYVCKRLNKEISCQMVCGGHATNHEQRQLRSIPHLLIGTPGRILDHISRDNISTTTIQTLIIDEFDKCMDLGFRDNITEIVSYLSNVSKRVFISATDNSEVKRYFMASTEANDDTFEVESLNFLTSSKTSSENVKYYVVETNTSDNLKTLKKLLLDRGSQTSIVFVGYRETVGLVSKFLHNEGFYISALHGGMEQHERERQLFRFVCGATNILICTDLASRGIDFVNLDNVIHFHLPNDEQVFIHRNGRTARCGNHGNVFLLVQSNEINRLSELNFNYNKFTPSQTRIPQKTNWEIIYIGKGKREKISRGDIVGFLMKVGEGRKEDLGKIEVFDHHSYAAIRETAVNDILSRLRGQKIKGLKTIVERSH